MSELKAAFIGPRHPQSTRPMKKGRALGRFGYPSRAAFVRAVIDRVDRGHSLNRIAYHFGCAWRTVKLAEREGRALEALGKNP